MPKNTPRPAARAAGKKTGAKARWTAEQRAERGKAPARPRGTAVPGRDRARGRGPSEGGAAERSTSGRPNWEPREKRDRVRGQSEPGTGGRSSSGRPNWEPREKPARPAWRGSDRRAAEGTGERTPSRRSPRSSDDGPRQRPVRETTFRQGTRRDDAPRRDWTPPVEDVVLDRLEATAIEATAGDGVDFASLGLGANIVRVLAEQGVVTPFPIQAATIPPALDGRDVLGRGRTGSGKTVAFGAPLVERLLRSQAAATSSERRRPGRHPRALVLAPTRELALQIDRTIQPIARSVGLFTTQIYGGVPYARQLTALSRGVDIVVGTPGRIQDLVEQGRLDLSSIAITVLDEADHMCELGFLEPVRELLARTPSGGQRLLFSATLDAGVAGLVEEFLVDPSVHEVEGDDTASETEHSVLVVDQRDKPAVLAELAAGEGRKLVFTRTRAYAEMLADDFTGAGIAAESIHGDLSQARRTRSLARFASGAVTVLVATDVAARGIHVDDVELVIQADAPDEYKTYLHRSGRTGRAGASGRVVTVVPRQRRRRTEELLARAGVTAEWSTVERDVRS